MQIPAMPEIGNLMEILLLVICSLLLLAVLAAVFRLGVRLQSIERFLAAMEDAPKDDSRPTGAPAAQSPFEVFLKEDPSRKTMKKSDQFKAYRKWRRENGMNWEP